MTETGDAADGALASGPLGMRLLEIVRAPEDAAFADEPVRYVLVALWHAGRLLLVRERVRDCWELPGGGIEPGESPRAAAARELWEETGQRVTPAQLAFTGFARTALPDRRVLHGAVYHAEATDLVDFTPNDEIAAAHWWDPTGPPPPEGLLQTVDTYLALHTRR